MRGAFQVENVRARADERHEAHDELLADRVDRRVRHLREVLLEVGVQQLGLRRQRRDRRVVAHRADGLLAALRHGRHQQLEALLRVAERLLQIEQPRRSTSSRRARCFGSGRSETRICVRFSHVSYGLLRGDLRLQLLVGDDAALLQVDEQHLARLQAPLLHDRLLRHGQHAGFRGHDHEVVLGHEVARRAQAVAVERGADLAAVGEGHRGRAVPRLHEAGVILVEGAPLAIHQRIAGPRLGDQHHGGVRSGE